MQQTLSQNQFVDQFQAIRPDDFSREALESLYDYFEECDPSMEFDPIAICCEFSESSPTDIINDYDLDIDPESENATDEVFEYLNNHTNAIGVLSNGFIVYAQF
jgi:hypothetical protein